MSNALLFCYSFGRESPFCRGSSPDGPSYSCASTVRILTFAYISSTSWDWEWRHRFLTCFIDSSPTDWTPSNLIAVFVSSDKTARRVSLGPKHMRDKTYFLASCARLLALQLLVPKVQPAQCRQLLHREREPSQHRSPS